MEWPLSPDNLDPESVNHLGVMEMVKERYLSREAPLALREGRASSFITHLATKAPSHLCTAVFSAGLVACAGGL